MEAVKMIHKMVERNTQLLGKKVLHVANLVADKMEKEGATVNGVSLGGGKKILISITTKSGKEKKIVVTSSNKTIGVFDYYESLSVYGKEKMVELNDNNIIEIVK